MSENSSAACTEKHVSFTPLCFSVDGLMGVETRTFMERLGDFLATKWDRPPYCTVIGGLRIRISLAFLRAMDLCLRGTRSKFRSFDIVDDASINPYLFS